MFGIPKLLCALVVGAFYPSAGGGAAGDAQVTSNLCIASIPSITTRTTKHFVATQHTFGVCQGFLIKKPKTIVLVAAVRPFPAQCSTPDD